MIKIEDVTFRYQNSDGGALEHVSVTIGDGECVLLCGRSGCGKTTLTRLVNGLIPHYYEGETSGKVMVNELDVTASELYETAKVVGSVFQNPRSQFFCVDTTSEIAFGCENMGMPECEIHRRMNECVEELKIEKLLGRNIFELSGGEKQKIACASVSALRPGVMVLDEPTSNLDMDAIEDLKSIISLWKSQGKTILIAEHRLYWLLDVCDRVIYMDNGKIAADMPMSDFRVLPADKISGMGLRSLSIQNLPIVSFDFHPDGELILKDYRFSYDKSEVLNIKERSIPTGAVVALVGHNGAGKSTLSRCLCGLEKKFKGVTLMDGEKLDRKKMLKKSYMVMQDVNHQLFCETVEDEVMLGTSEENGENAPAILGALDLSDFKERHPMSLSGGQKQRVAIASAILAEKEILIFDEPTSGLDFEHMEQTASLIRSLAGRKTILIVTHDPELIVRCATHILHLESGRENEFYRLTEENRDKFDGFFCK